MKNLIFCVTLGVILYSCAGSMNTMGQKPTKVVAFKMDDVIVDYPKSRIDPIIDRIAILGSGGDESEITNNISDIFIKSEKIKVVEPGNLKQILGGRIIEYGTGLTALESQAISRMLQVKYVLFYNEKQSPPSDYRLGGRVYVQLNIKIVNVLNGEVLYQDVSNMGIFYSDPKQFGYSSITERSTSEFNALRRRCFIKLGFKLRYAVGDCPLGMFFADTSGDLKIKNIPIGSPVNIAGLKVGDKLISINGQALGSYVEFKNLLAQGYIKQGEVIIIVCERDGVLKEFKVKIPLIPVPMTPIIDETAPTEHKTDKLTI